MRVEVKLDPACTEPRVVILTDRLTEEVSALVKRLSEDAPQAVAGFREDQVRLLDQGDIIRVYAADGKVFAVTAEGEWRLRLRLYELEARLDRRRFVRISNSELVNLGWVRGFDLSLSGTFRVSLSNGTATYVSRRYIKKIKQLLGM